MFDQRLNPPASRWISVIFLQGHAADGVLGMIDGGGAAAAIEYLQQWDLGEATTDAALANGYVYDRIPAGSTDRVVESDVSPYALTYSARFGYVSLLRRHPVESEVDPVPECRALATHAARVRQDAAGPWVATRGLSARYAGHSVAL